MNLHPSPRADPSPCSVASSAAGLTQDHAWTIKCHVGNVASKKPERMANSGLQKIGLQNARVLQSCQSRMTLPLRCPTRHRRSINTTTTSMATSSIDQARNALDLSADSWLLTPSRKTMTSLSSIYPFKKSSTCGTRSRPCKVCYYRPSVTTWSAGHDTCLTLSKLHACDLPPKEISAHLQQPRMVHHSRNWTPSYGGTLPGRGLKAQFQPTPLDTLVQFDGTSDAPPTAGRRCCPDRFMRETPTKEAFLLAANSGNDMVDPFAPAASRKLKTAERFTTMRSASRPNVWTVGGSAVTEGVASTSDGRGRRVTSGSSAPHHAAEFFRSKSPAEETVAHGRRLAIAMDIDQSGPVVSPPSSPRSRSIASSPESPHQVKWNNSR